MDILLLRTFLTVCNTGSFSAAAEEMNSVQSNITNRIKRLEDHFGQPAFERGRGGARLNQFGERLRIHAEDLLNRFDAVERDLREAAGAITPLRLGSMETTAATRIPGVLKMFKQKYPDTPISLRTAPTGELLSLLWSNKVDAAFVAGPVDSTRFNCTHAFTERLVIASSSHETHTNAFLTFRTGCSYRSIAETWLREHGKGDTEIIEMGTLDGILGCVEIGMGITVAPIEAINGYRGADNLTLSDLPDPYSHTETMLAWRIDRKISGGLEGLIDVLR